MNEKIKQLAVEADNYAYKMNPELDSYGRYANPRKFQQDRDTKFAELIVRECVNQVELTWMNQNGWSKNDQCVNVIKEHFGVE